MALRIEDYAFIGDCHAAALVGRDGSIDWLCLPRFDSPAIFASLVGKPEHGHWIIAPVEEGAKVRRRYHDDTMVLETEFTTTTGSVAVIDFMTPRSSTADLIRLIECRRGKVDMYSRFMPRMDYGSVIPWMRRRDHLMISIAGPDSLYLFSPENMSIEHDAGVAEFTVDEGDSTSFTLVWQGAERPEPPLPPDARLAVEVTRRWWRDWMQGCTYEGDYRPIVRRSLLTLKALTYNASGGILAAPTTSLPVRLEGDRNWDYRYCWLRDATFALIAMLNAGYRDEAKSWREWLLRAVAGRPSQMHIMYGLHGERRLTEMELPWLPGYQGATPVRIGNAAYAQQQLDVYGEVMDVCFFSAKNGLPAGHDDWRIERAVLSFLESKWEEPDDGLWELRIPSRHYTHSKMMAWVAFDRAVKLAEFGFGGDVEHFETLRDKIHDQVCRQGFNEDVGAFVQWYGTERLDASLLMMPLVGFLPVDDPRVAGTIAAIERDLMDDGFVVRYRPVLEAPTRSHGESAFLLCSFWLVSCYVLQGRHAEAKQLFDRLVGLANDVGLLAEGYDTKQQRFTGNFPQAFSHIGLINAAYHLAHVTEADERATSEPTAAQ